jgi:hypothetical protein
MSVGETEDGLVARANSFVVETDDASGAIWAADESQLWNPELNSELVSPRRVRAIARKLLGDLGLAPAADGVLSVVELDPGATLVATRTGRDRVERQLDVQARFAGEIAIETPDGPRRVPVVGGGARLGVMLGHEGRPIGFRSAWRPVVERFDVEAIDQTTADERFRALTDGLDLVRFESFLAYYAAPAGVQQEVMVPVYVYSGEIATGGRTLPMRLVTVPATELGPIVPDLPAQKPRKPPRKDTRPTGTSPAGARRSMLTAAANPFEAGTSWIGLSGGLGGSQANAQGFVDGLAADGWNVNFNWGDANAWESDWRRNDDTWVDAADFVFYTGHANGDLWVLSSPDDGSLDFTEVGNGPGRGRSADLFGQNDLEWLIVAACGPLEDDIISKGGGDALDRWDGAFDGLHQLMGYGAVTFDNTDEGRKVVQYARAGATVS